MIKAAVLGSPISHSLSPLLHNRAYEILGIEGEYSAIEVKADTLETFLQESINEEWSGFNLTMPLKESVLASSLVDCDDLSSRTRSANTLVLSGNRYRATSTDATAFERLLQPYAVDRVAIIGGGGTARAAVAALAERSASISVLLRTLNRIDVMEQIAPKVEFSVETMDSTLEGFDLVINTTPAGVADRFVASLGNVSGLYFESLYHPWPTELSFAWSQLGGKVLHGLDLLVEQALDAISLMTDIRFDYSSMREELLKVAIARLDSQLS